MDSAATIKNRAQLSAAHLYPNSCKCCIAAMDNRGAMVTLLHTITTQTALGYTILLEEEKKEKQEEEERQ